MISIKNYIAAHKTAIIIIVAVVLLIGAYFLGLNHTSKAVQEAQPVLIPQELTDNINALQNKLDISEANAKALAAAIDKIQTDQTTPVANYYVSAPTVEKAADIVQQQIKNNDPTLPPAALEKTDRTVVTAITKDSTGATLPVAQQKVDVYKIDLDHHIEFGGGGGVVNGKTVFVAAIQYNTKNVAYEIIGNKDSGIGIVKYRF
jgi:post-segregation antitoxin (ccd killing protein)